VVLQTLPRRLITVLIVNGVVVQMAEWVGKEAMKYFN